MHTPTPKHTHLHMYTQRYCLLYLSKPIVFAKEILKFKLLD